VLRECWRVSRGAIYYNHKPRVVKGNLRSPLVLCGEIPVRQVIIWNRGSGFNYMDGAYVPMCEWIILMAKPEWSLRDKSAAGVGDVWNIPPDSGNEHPASFPVGLPSMAIQTSGAETILDPFAGSGTTGRAAKDLGKRAVLIEREERYCEIAARRLAQDVLPFDCPNSVNKRSPLRFAPCGCVNAEQVVSRNS
jgi:DNA modification methylase